MLMAGLRSEKQLEIWLDDKSPAVARVLAVRMALRVLPLANARGNDLDLMASSLRALFVSWAAATWAVRDIKAATAYAASAANAAAEASGPRASAHAGYAAASAAKASDPRYATALDVINTAYAASSAAEGIWETIDSDAGWLEAHFLVDGGYEPHRLFNNVLWTDLPQVDSPLTRWHMYKSELLDRNEDWSIWIEWYDRRLNGDQYGWDVDQNKHEELCVGLAQESEAFWDRPAAEVNAEIKARVEAARLPPASPTRQAASVRPVWRDGRLVQDDSVSSVADSEALQDMLEAIAEDFASLADRLNGTANIPESAVTLLREASEQISSTGMARRKLFRLTNRLLELQLYGATVQAEWSPENGVRFHALTVQLDNLIKTFPEIRDYLESVPRPERDLAQVRALAEAEDVAIEGLRSEAARPVVDDSVTIAMQDSRDAVADDLGPWIGCFDPHRPRSLGSVENMLGGLNNTIGELSDRALKSLNTKAGDHADKAGDYATDAVISVYRSLKKASKAGAVGSATAGTTAVITHMDILAQSNVAMGSLVALMTYIYLSKTSSGQKP